MDMTVIICAAVPILLIAFGMFVSNIVFTLRAEKTTGIVVAYATKRGNKSGVTHAEIVEFQTADGKKIQFTEKAYRSRFIMNTGHTVNVIYDLNKPEKARINSFATLYLAPIILVIVGSCLVIFNLPMFSGLGKSILMFIQNFVEKVPFL